MGKTVLIVGWGEVGESHARLLSRVAKAYGVDVLPGRVPDAYSVKRMKSRPDIMLVAIRYSDDFVKTVKSYSDKFNPTLISILSTVPPGTCEIVGSDVTHSTTRGLHPNLETGLREITKHVGGKKAEEVAAIFRLCGIKCVTHAVARTTEAAHILNNASYGVNLMWADEMQKLCRLWGVDYYETVMRYTETNNDGYEALGHKTKVRMILTPPGGEIGGHCVKQSANLVPENDRTAMLAMLAKYDKEVKP